MTSKTNKIISLVVAIAIIISLVVLIYVNLPKPTETTDDEPPAHKESPTIFTIIYDDEQYNFTLGEL